MKSAALMRLVWCHRGWRQFGFQGAELWRPQEQAKRWRARISGGAPSTRHESLYCALHNALQAPPGECAI